MVKLLLRWIDRVHVPARADVDGVSSPSTSAFFLSLALTQRRIHLLHLGQKTPPVACIPFVKIVHLFYILRIASG